MTVNPNAFPLVSREYLLTGSLSELDYNAGTIVLMDKPPLWTSFDVVHKIRNLTKAKKVGHTGTLDPMATGLLILVTGSATRMVGHYMGLQKVYHVILELGKTTDTYDRDGKISAEKPVPEITESEFLTLIKKYIGLIKQTPPPFSAIKKSGRPLYLSARKGIPVQVEPRTVNIINIDLVKFALPYVECKVTCSKGTYIRSLVNDIGEDIGCGAYVFELRRLAIGNYTVEQAVTVADFQNQIKVKREHNVIH